MQSLGKIHEVNRAHTVGKEIEYTKSNQFSIQTVALVIGTDLLFFAMINMTTPMQTGAKEALETTP